ncbi:MAG: hypothetical protein ACXWP4_21775 [Polyangiales bacterium]
MRLGLLRGFLLDLALAGVAGALGWHPVWSFLRAHPEVVYWGCGSLHIALIPLFFSQILGGHAKTDDFLNKDDGHARAWTWATVGVMVTSFVGPFGCSLVMPVTLNLAFSMAVLFAPFFSFMGPMLAVLIFPKIATRDVKIPNLLGHWLPRTIVTLLTAAYLALQESTMFLASESKQEVAGLLVFLGLFLAYLPVRLFLFYATAVDRRELVSVLASFAFVTFQLTVR